MTTCALASVVSDVRTNGSLTWHSIGVRVGFCINADTSKSIYSLRYIQMTVCMCCNIRILIKPSTNNIEGNHTAKLLNQGSTRIQRFVVVSCKIPTYASES